MKYMNKNKTREEASRALLYRNPCAAYHVSLQALTNSNQEIDTPV